MGRLSDLSRTYLLSSCEDTDAKTLFFLSQSNGNQKNKQPKKTSLCNNIRTTRVEKQQEEKTDTIPLLLE